MKLIDTHIAGLFLIEPKVFGDERGYFFESFNAAWMHANGLDFQCIQDNEAKSGRGVLRGLHFQRPPYAQTKLVRAISGEILDVVVDLRAGSKTYGESYMVRMDDKNKLQMFVPKGFAHGYIVLSETAIVAYKVDQRYAPESEDGILWNDPDLAIDWGLSPEEIVLSAKDKVLKTWSNFKTPFE